jgi:opacity protein-like surface antigen
MRFAMRRFGFSTALAFFFIISALGVFAPDAAAGDGYLLLKGGVYSPQADDVDNFDEGAAVELALGKFILPMVALELGGGYFESSNNGADLTVYPLTLAAKVRLPLPIVKPYAIAGGGAYFAELETPGGGSVDDTAFGYFAGVGIDFKVLFLLVNLEAKYFRAQPDFGVDVDIDGMQATVGVGLEF